MLEDYLESNISKKKNVFEFRDLMARFNTNIISSVAFGIDNDCINEPQHIFRRMGAKLFEASFANAFRGVIGFMIPKLFYKLGLKAFDSDVTDFIRKVVNETVEYREKSNYARNDFMQLLIQLKNQGYVSVDKNDDPEEIKNDTLNSQQKDSKKLTMDELTANVLLFFIAGKN